MDHMRMYVRSYVQLSFQCWRKERQNGVINVLQITNHPHLIFLFSVGPASGRKSQQWPSIVATLT